MWASSGLIQPLAQQASNDSTETALSNASLTCLCKSTLNPASRKSNYTSTAKEGKQSLHKYKNMVKKRIPGLIPSKCEMNIFRAAFQQLPFFFHVSTDHTQNSPSHSNNCRSYCARHAQRVTRFCKLVYNSSNPNCTTTAASWKREACSVVEQEVFCSSFALHIHVEAASAEPGAPHSPGTAYMSTWEGKKAGMQLCGCFAILWHHEFDEHVAGCYFWHN